MVERNGILEDCRVNEYKMKQKQSEDGQMEKYDLYKELILNKNSLVLPFYIADKF